MSTVTLTSPSGWSVEVRVGDPYYKDYFDSIEEIDGYLPDAITVPSIVEEQWSHWKKLEEILEFTEKRKALDLPFLYIYGATAYGSLKENFVLLADVQHIQQAILTLPDDWMYHVAVDERTSQNERMDYYRKVGTMIRNSDYFALSRFSNNLNTYLRTDFLSDFDALYDPIYRIKELSKVNPNYIPLWEECIARDYMTLHTGIWHSAWLRSEPTESRDVAVRMVLSKEVNWNFIIWKDIVKIGVGCVDGKLILLSRFHSSQFIMLTRGYDTFESTVKYIEETRDQPPILDSIAYRLAGMETTVRPKQYSVSIGKHKVDIADPDELYKRLFKTSLDFSLEELGLDVIRKNTHHPHYFHNAPVRYDSSDLIAVVAVKNIWALRGDKDEDLANDFSKSVKRVVSQLGVDALTLMVEKLLSNEKLANDRVLSFLSEAVTYLETH
jgi:hypothetical protein